MHIITWRLHLLIAVLCGVSVSIAQQFGTFTPTGNLTTQRRGHTATLLPDGRVLIAGGWAQPEAMGNSRESAELYDPATGTFTPTGSMATNRRYHTATVLPDERVLIAGGILAGNDGVASAELYDPVSGRFTPTGNMGHARYGHVASLLPDGKVLIAGGANGSSCAAFCPSFLTAAEIYDPLTGRFSPAGDLANPIYEQNSAILLPDGKVFIAGSSASSVFDIFSRTFRGVAGLASITAAWPDGQALAGNGKVLLTGGDPEALGATTFAALYDPAAGDYNRIPDLMAARALHTSTTLADGSVLIAGGSGSANTAELYDPVANSFRYTGNLVTPRCCHTATLLNDGSVLIAGGTAGIRTEIYTPAQEPMPLTLLGVNLVAQGEALEIYLTGLLPAGAIPPQVVVGGRIAEVLYFGDAPGNPGLNQVNVRMPKGIDAVPATSVHLLYFGRWSNYIRTATK